MDNFLGARGVGCVEGEQTWTDVCGDAVATLRSGSVVASSDGAVATLRSGGVVVVSSDGGKGMMDGSW